MKKFQKLESEVKKINEIGSSNLMRRRSEKLELDMKEITINIKKFF